MRRNYVNTGTFSEQYLLNALFLYLMYGNVACFFFRIMFSYLFSITICNRALKRNGTGRLYLVFVVCCVGSGLCGEP